MSFFAFHKKAKNPKSKNRVIANERSECGNLQIQNRLPRRIYDSPRNDGNGTKIQNISSLQGKS